MASNEDRFADFRKLASKRKLTDDTINILLQHNYTDVDKIRTIQQNDIDKMHIPVDGKQMHYVAKWAKKLNQTAQQEPARRDKTGSSSPPSHSTSTPQRAQSNSNDALIVPTPTARQRVSSNKEELHASKDKSTNHGIEPLRPGRHHDNGSSVSSGRATGQSGGGPLNQPGAPTQAIGGTRDQEYAIQQQMGASAQTRRDHPPNVTGQSAGQVTRESTSHAGGGHSQGTSSQGHTSHSQRYPRHGTAGQGSASQCSASQALAVNTSTSQTPPMAQSRRHSIPTSPDNQLEPSDITTNPTSQDVVRTNQENLAKEFSTKGKIKPTQMILDLYK